MSNNNTSLQQPSDTKNTSTPTVANSLSSSRESTSPPQQQVQPESSTYLHSPSPLANKRSHIEYFQSTPQPSENATSETLDSDAVSLFFRTSPRVTPAGTNTTGTTSNYNRFTIPSPRPNSNSRSNPLSPPPPPKYNMASPEHHPHGHMPPHPHAHPAHPLAHAHPAHQHNKGNEVEIQHPNDMAAPSKHGHGVEMVLKASETAEQNEQRRDVVHTTGHGHHDYFKSTVGTRPPTTNNAGVSGTTSTMGHGYGPQGQQSGNTNKTTLDDGKSTSPPREQKNTEVAFVITPGDMTKPGDTPRRPAPRHQHGYEVPNVPESPYGAYPSPYGQPPPHPGYYHPHGYYHPQSPVKSSKSNPAEEAGEHAGGGYPHPHPPPPYGYPPPYAYGYDRYYPEDPYRADVAGAPHPHSPGKRQRVNDDNDSKSKGGQGGGQGMSDRERDRETEEGHDYSVPPPAYRFPPTRPYYERGPPPHPGYPYYNPAVSESFDSGERSGDRSESPSKRSPPRRTAPGPHPPVSKASSYPPPPSPPGRYGPGPQGDSSASSYPGARRARGHHGERGGSGYSYDNAGIYSRGAPPQHGGPPGESARYYPSGGQGRYEDGHVPPGPPPSEGYYGREPARGYPPPGFYGGGEGEYYHRSGPPGMPLPGAQEDVHPLLRDERSRSHPLPSGDDNRTHTSHSSPPRRKRGDGSVSSRELSSPNKPKPSTTAQAAIAAGMTEPASAKEVDFDITDPPRDPFTPPSAKPLCSQSADINIHDVLCGRGGGTNTQVGNRRFRSLVQEFQPTYLLCRRKEKPLIARTIVLIIRNRGGRFLKKNEDDGGFYEVGDEKAEAKTSQALREGLDVRASRSTMDGKKKNRRKKKAASSNESATEPVANTAKSPARLKKEDTDVNMDPTASQRDGPPPHHDAYPHYPPPGFYYGYGAGAGGGAGDGYYPPPYGAMNYPMSGAGGPYSPSRKRARAPPHASGESPYEYQQFPPPSSYNKNYMYPYPSDYPNHGPPHGANDAEHEEGGTSMWEDFSPPRPMVKKQQDVDSNPTGEE